MIKKAFLICLCISVSTLWSCGSKQQDKEQAHDEVHEELAGEIVFTPKQADESGLTVEIVEPKQFAAAIEVGGELLPAQGDEITVTAQIEGNIVFTKKSVVEGTPVRKGQVLFYISSRANADGDASVKVSAEYEAAQAAYKRAKSLAESHIVKTRELEDAKLRFETARAAYEALGTVSDAGAGVSAPASGYIKSVTVNEGQHIETGASLVTIVKNSRMQLRAQLPQRYYSTIGNISGANFKLPYSDTLYSTEQLGGSLLSFGKTGGSAQGYIPVTFDLKECDGLLPGSYAQIYLISEPREGVISVPVDAIIEEQGLFFVYVQLDEECYRKQEISVGQTDGARNEVLKGLHLGDKVVVKGARQVRLASMSSAIPDGHSH